MASVSSARSQRPECIRLRGVRQNNLKGFDLDIPLGQFIVVTGLSGSGKSSLVFDTLHAEGQRRYVETFSAYTRQFLDLLSKPKVDSVENIRPSIAIEQTNTVKTSRSTVGTMTELTDYAKVWFSHVARCYDPETGAAIEDDTPERLWSLAHAGHRSETLVIAFGVKRPASLPWAEVLQGLTAQSYARVLLGGENEGWTVHTVEALTADARPLPEGEHELLVVQDRVKVSAENKARFLEAVETAYRFGQNELRLLRSAPDGSWSEVGHYSRGLHSPKTGRRFRPATPALFSFNSPLGACPRCRGFGRTIEINWRLAIPDENLSIEEGAIKCWEGEVYSESKKDLTRMARKKGIRLDRPFKDLPADARAWIIDGDPGYGEEGRDWPQYWYGVKGFFRWLEKNTYKMHVRVFLSRYRSYVECPDCRGARLQPEALCWKWEGATLPDLYRLPVSELRAKLEGHGPAGGDRTVDLSYESMLTRLRYLEAVGLGYLTLDRSSRTLSGGEVERVNLTSCLGTHLVDTLFVLDEPSVGLHPRDIDRLIAIIRRLTDAGNTVVVVEHDEAMMRAADHLIEVGPEPGSRGGHIVFNGSLQELVAGRSLTGDYLAGRRSIDVPTRRRPVGALARRGPANPWLTFKGATKHNVRDADVALPLQRLVCLSGVSGSGKSTLLDHVVYQGLLQERRLLAEDPADVREIRSDLNFGDVVFVDQSPLSRTPRSNPALYTEAWDLIRELFARTPEAQAAGMTASTFSFNAGDGRCEHCQGLGYERVEMQFLSDVFAPCPVCEGRRFKPEVLAIRWEGKSVDEILATSVDDALQVFASKADIRSRLATLAEVGLGYLTLGQPLNTLSGGESQRLKLVRYLSSIAVEAATEPALLLLDEPTTGLHRHDVKRLIGVMHALVERGHSLIVIEHNLDVLKSADWLIEVGPEAGADGGRILFAGTPEEAAKVQSATAPYLREALAGREKVAPEEDRALALLEDAGGDEPYLAVHGARENNLKNLHLQIPHRRLSVVTGVSGSGKSTLAFDIVFAEGQRRFMESMSPYARQFVEQLPRPAVDRVTGIPPTVAIEQRVTRGSRKSTVATITEVAQYLRLLYARLGVQHHPETDRPVEPMSVAALRKLLSQTMAAPKARKAKHLYLCAPLVRGRKGHHQPLVDWMERQGYTLLRADGRLQRVDTFEKLDRYKEHDIEVVVADLRETDAKPVRKGQDPLERALSLGKGSCFLLHPDGEILAWFSTTRTDAETGESFPELDPKHFSFNSPRGWCPTCRGHGRVYPWMAQLETEEGEEDPALRLREFGVEFSDEEGDAGQPCPECRGARLNRIARAVKLHRKGRAEPLSLPQLLALTSGDLLAALKQLSLDARGKLIAQDILAQIEERLRFLDHVGLGYLSLDRATETLSGGEAQRIRLAAQLGSNLSGVLYVLDEPSIGLHARDSERLIETLEALREKGNTLLVVEHDDDLMERADHIIDLGPGAGRHGGDVLAQGTPAEIKRSDASLTGVFLAKGIAHPLRGAYRPVAGNEAKGLEWLEVKGAALRNLKGFDLKLPLGRLVMVAGPSGAGKSTLFRDLLHPAVTTALAGKKLKLSGKDYVKLRPEAAEGKGPPFSQLSLGHAFRSVIEVDQSPIGKTPRSTPATYLGIFDLIRSFFATLPEARMRGHTASRFSFNTAGGRCETCSGAGRIKLEMAFMPSTFLPCDSCGGSRYGSEVLTIRWKDKSIADVLGLTFEEAATFFDFHSQLQAVCQLMVDCGLGYLNLGQSSPTLSGGEAQRLKLVAELSKGLHSYRERSRGENPRNLYILEEPTIGLHLSDCEKLIKVLHALVDQGHTVVVIEHHLDLLAEADWLIELGPTGGPKGGQLLYAGPLAGVLKAKKSVTGPYLRKRLQGR